MLTAAHCVSDDKNNEIPAANVSVCRFDTSPECLGVSDIQFPDSYSGGSADGGGSDFNDDWALLELTSTWEDDGRPEAEDMDMSRVGDGTLDALTRINNLGLPGFVNGCSNVGGGTLMHNDEREPLTATYNKSVRMKIETGPGHSGGPVYYCPGGSSKNRCESGDKAFVFAVHAGYNTLVKRAVGPKVAYFRDTALAILFD